MKRSTRMLLMNSGKTDKRGSGMDHGYNPQYYDDGRYAPMSAYDGGRWDTLHPYPPYIPPVYRQDDPMRRNDQRNASRESAINRIGFSVEGEMERIPQEPEHQYKRNSNHHSDTHGYADARGAGVPIQFTREIATEWTGDMENADGSKGPHWSMEQVSQVMEQRGIDCDPLQFFAVLNSVYSDYCAVAKKHGVNKMDFYADLAKAWLEDPDAAEDKASRYFEYIVKH